MAAIDKVLEQALALSPDERDQLIEALVASREPEEGELTKEEWENAWATELERRAREVDEGRVQLIPHEDVMRRLRAKFPQR